MLLIRPYADTARRTPPITLHNSLTRERGAAIEVPGDVRQSRVTAEIDLGALQLAHHGERVILEDDSGNDVGLGIFGDYGADVVAGATYVTKIEADYAKHTAKVELFTIPN